MLAPSQWERCWLHRPPRCSGGGRRRADLAECEDAAGEGRTTDLPGSGRVDGGCALEARRRRRSVWFAFSRRLSRDHSERREIDRALGREDGDLELVACSCGLHDRGDAHGVGADLGRTGPELSEILGRGRAPKQGDGGREHDSSQNGCGRARLDR